MSYPFTILPIRHHGPGSARSLRRALDRLKPDVVLLEGPPDGAEVLALASHTDMKAPVAMLVHAEDDPSEAVYYPFAEFSPEWNAIRWGQGKGVPVRFFDLPQANRMALDRAEVEAVKAALSKALPVEPGAPAVEPPADVTLPDAAPQVLFRTDPLSALAQAAGFDDGERWWEHVVEHRRNVENDADADLSLFAAITEAMGAVREKEDITREGDDLREAHMRRAMREAQKEGFERIAVVCGAFHAPALLELETTKKGDEALLKGLPKIKTKATWVPWTHGLLTTGSGYGAGVHAPGWYQHLFTAKDLLLERWLTRVATLLRAEDIDCSSAHVIESVRLAHTLATMRARPIPDLTDISDAARSVFCHDSDAPLRLIAHKLLIGDELGEVPAETPQVPLQQDLARLQKSLRLKPEALEKTLELDLRNETDLARSHLLHRLRLLNINWGEPKDAGGRTKGTFKEPWLLRWDPHFAIRLIESARYGNTVQDAATHLLQERVNKTTELPALAGMLDTVLLADLPASVDTLLHRIDTIAALASDVAALMDALPPLARATRYGNVRQTDTSLLHHTLAGLLPRITANLPPAVASLNDEAAEQFTGRISHTHGAIALLNSPGPGGTNAALGTGNGSVPALTTGTSTDWHATLHRIESSPTVHGLVRGKSARLLFDAGALSPEATATSMSLTLSPGTDPGPAAHYLQGFLENSGLILLHDPKLLSVLDTWLSGIPEDAFNNTLPLLRRTFSTFPAPERRQIGQAVSQGKGRPGDAPADNADQSLDPDRAQKVIPVLQLLLGT